jgi:hypothetical protein
MNSRFPIVLLSASLSAFAQTNTPNLTNAQIKAATPTNFVLQILEPTGGKVQRPKDWFFAKFHDNRSTYSWNFSPEDPSKAGYTTLVRIQAIVGVKEYTGKTPKEFIEDVVRTQKKKAEKVVKSYPESKQKSFTRICMETELGQKHILWSLFWGDDDLDVAVVSIASTPTNLWDTYSPVFDKMNGFELIDMKRTDK